MLDIPKILSEADIFAFSTTLSEGFGIALIEAMAAKAAHHSKGCTSL